MVMNGTAYVGIKATLTCLDEEECAGTMMMDDGENLAIGVFTNGELRNIRCIRCRGAIKEAAEVLARQDLEYAFR